MGLKPVVPFDAKPAVARPAALGDGVYEAILGLLVHLKIAPGSRIAIDSLVRELGVSQTPIRQALTRLESEGLVQKTHLVGYSAAPQIGPKRFEELFSMRILIEPHLAGLAASQITDEQVGDLDALQAEMSRFRPSEILGHYGLFAQKDSEFHSQIASISRHQLGQETLSRLPIHLHLFRLVFHARVTDEAIEEHANIINSLRKRDSKAAVNAMKNHLMRSKERFAPALE